MKTDLQRLLDTEGCLRRADHPRLASACDWALRSGELIALLRGVYTTPALATRLDARARAVCLADPDAVITGAAAAALHGWECAGRPSVVTLSSARLRGNHWALVSQRRVDPDFVCVLRATRLTTPALTALDLAGATEGASLDEALRRGVPLAQLHEAIDRQPRQRGARLTRTLLRDCRDEPWSPAERRGHTLLRAAGILGWMANLRVRDDNGSIIAAIDIAFLELRLGLEIDGVEWHSHPWQVSRDRERDRRLAERGWMIVRIPAAIVFDDPEGFIASIESILRARRLLHVRGTDASQWR